MDLITYVLESDEYNTIPPPDTLRGYLCLLTFIFHIMKLEVPIPYLTAIIRLRLARRSTEEIMAELHCPGWLMGQILAGDYKPGLIAEIKKKIKRGEI